MLGRRRLRRAALPRVTIKPRSVRARPSRVATKELVLPVKKLVGDKTSSTKGQRRAHSAFSSTVPKGYAGVVSLRRTSGLRTPADA